MTVLLVVGWDVNEPMMCVTMTRETIEDSIVMLSTTDADMVEHRIDYMRETPDFEAIYSSFDRPIIATDRPVIMGGRFRGTEATRIQQLSDAIDAGAQYVDIERNAPPVTIKRVMDAARHNDCRVIISRHYLDSTPPLSELLSVFSEMCELGADIAKIVVMPRNAQEASRILSLYSYLKEDSIPLIAFGMGSLGRFTRVAALCMGAPFMYVSESQGLEAAPGQIPLSTFREIMEVLSK